MFASKMMFEMVMASINISEKGYDDVWDTIMFDCIWKYFQEVSILYRSVFRTRVSGFG
jgi:hypothetical protein